MGWATQYNTVRDPASATYLARAHAQSGKNGLVHETTYLVHRGLSQASCVIVTGFRAALDLDIYPLSNLIRSRCAERAKPGRGKPVLIMNIGIFASFFFHAISLQRSRFSKILMLIFMPL